MKNNLTTYALVIIICGVGLIALHAFGISTFAERPFAFVLARMAWPFSFVRSLFFYETDSSKFTIENHARAYCEMTVLDNKQLRALLSLNDLSPQKPIIASVVGFSDSIGRSHMIIDRGSTDGIREGMAALTAGPKLVGTVYSVGSATSEITLLSDDESSIIASVIKNDSELLGLVHGSYQISTLFDNVENTTQLEKGDTIITSSLNSTIPAGILIGTVHEIINTQNDVFQQATVNLAVKPETLRFVGIVQK